MTANVPFFSKPKAEKPATVEQRFPEQAAQMNEAIAICKRAIEGGLFQEDVAAARAKRQWFQNWYDLRSAVVAPRLRDLLESTGVRVLCYPRRAADRGVILHVDVPGGCLQSIALGRRSFVEG